MTIFGENSFFPIMTSCHVTRKLTMGRFSFWQKWKAHTLLTVSGICSGVRGNYTRFSTKNNAMIVVEGLFEAHYQVEYRKIKMIKIFSNLGGLGPKDQFWGSLPQNLDKYIFNII